MARLIKYYHKRTIGLNITKRTGVCMLKVSFTLASKCATYSMNLFVCITHMHNNKPHIYKCIKVTVPTPVRIISWLLLLLIQQLIQLLLKTLRWKIRWCTKQIVQKLAQENRVCTTPLARRTKLWFSWICSFMFYVSSDWHKVYSGVLSMLQLFSSRNQC